MSMSLKLFEALLVNYARLDGYIKKLSVSLKIQVLFKKH